MKDSDYSPITIITDETSESRIIDVIAKIESLAKVQTKVIHIRVENIV